MNPCVGKRKGPGPGGGLDWLPLAAVLLCAALLARCGVAAGASWPDDPLLELVGAAPPEAKDGAFPALIGAETGNAALAHDGVLALGGRFRIGVGTGVSAEAERMGEIGMRNRVLFAADDAIDAAPARSCVVSVETPETPPSGRGAPRAGPIDLLGRNLAFVMDGDAFRYGEAGGGPETAAWIDGETGAGAVRLLNPLAVRLNNAASGAFVE